MNQISNASNQSQQQQLGQPNSYMYNEFQDLQHKYLGNNQNQNHVSNLHQPSTNINSNNSFQGPNSNNQVPINNQSQVPNNNSFNSVFQNVNGVPTANFDDIVKYQNSLQIKEIQPKSGKISRIIETTAPKP